MSRQSIYILDDDSAFVESLRWVLEEHDYKVQGFVGFDDAYPVLQKISPEDPACLLLDVRMPDISGIEVFNRLIDEGVDLPVIFLTGHGDVALAVEVMAQGALSFLEKPFDHERLFETVTLAFSSGVQSRRQSIKGRLLATERSEIIHSLSTRESEVLNGIVEGLSAKAIAEQLHISAKTVEYHRTKILAKLNCKNVAQLQRAVALHESGSFQRRIDN